MSPIRAMSCISCLRASGRSPAKGAQMPGFEGALTDEQLASLLAYLRVHFANRPPWVDVSVQARDIIQHKDENER